jgi:hypothetical protein
MIGTIVDGAHVLSNATHGVLSEFGRQAVAEGAVHRET